MLVLELENKIRIVSIRAAAKETRTALRSRTERVSNELDYSAGTALAGILPAGAEPNVALFALPAPTNLAC